MITTYISKTVYAVLHCIGVPSTSSWRCRLHLFCKSYNANSVTVDQ